MSGRAGERRRDELMRALIGSTGEGFLAVSADGVVRLLNEAGAEMLGKSRKNVLGRSVETIENPCLVGEVCRAMKRRGDWEKSFVFTCSGKTMSCRMVPYQSDEGDGVAVTLRDDTELVRERERSEAVLASTGDGLIVFSTSGDVTYINPAACGMLGLRPRKVLGKNLCPRDLLGFGQVDQSQLTPCWEIKNCRRRDCPAFGQEELRCWLMSGTLCGEGWPLTFKQKLDECRECAVFVRNAGLVGDPGMSEPTELTLPDPKDKSRKRVVKARIDPVIDVGGDYIGCVLSMHDITTEYEINQMKNEFVSTVSHELRTPLTSIKGYIDLILDGEAGEINEIQREFLEIVKENGDRLVALVNDLLDISRIESGRLHLKIEPLDMSDIIAGVADTFRTVADQQGIELVTRVPRTLPLVAGDRDRVGQVLMNLVSNAIKYTVAGGGTVEVVARRDGDRVVVSVSDTGIGIPKEAQKALFSKFYRVDSSLTRNVGGTGLGLSITKSIVELLGGKVWFRSAPGHGSRFSFSIPVASHDLVRMPYVQGPEGEAVKVLVVDREPQVADLIETYLTDRGYSVVKAHTGWDAVQKAVSEKPKLITLDVMLEDVDGFELLQQLKDIPETADIPILVLSIVCDEGRSCRLGAADYLEKPIDKRRLMRVIDRVVGGSTAPKVLIADDDRAVVDVLRRTLLAKGFAVACAYDGREAMAALEKHKPDLVLLDLKMPEMDGYQVIQAMKTGEETRDIPVVVITAHRLDRGKTDLLKMTAGQIAKPFSADSIVESVETMLAKEA